MFPSGPTRGARSADHTLAPDTWFSHLRYLLTKTSKSGRQSAQLLFKTDWPAEKNVLESCSLAESYARLSEILNNFFLRGAFIIFMLGLKDVAYF